MTVRYGILTLATLGLVLSSTAVPRADPLTSTQQARIDSIARRSLREQHVSGLTIGVGRNGKLLFARGYGLRDRSARLPANAGTVYDIGSITKQFTATAVMLLVERRRIALDAPISRYLPDFPHGGEITIRELLNQTSGLHDYLEDKALYASILNSTVQDRPISYYAQMGASKPLMFAPGSKWAYSNTNYATLGTLVAKVSGVPYERFVEKNILQPDLSETKFAKTSLPVGDDAAQGYNYVRGRFVRVVPYDMSWANAAGALSSTVHDLVAWDGLFFGDRILSAESVRVALTPPVDRPVLRSKDPENNYAAAYAFGWVIGKDEGRSLVWHNGGTIGYHAMNLVFPHDGLEIIVLTNATDSKPESTALQIARMFYAP
jgi:D-alanyl-D-alanine carboxypeptidase